MAAAFAALVSLKNNIRHIILHPSHSFTFFDREQQLRPIWDNVIFLINFMTSYDDSHGATREAAEALEIRIARAAERAEDVIESHVVDQIRGGKTRNSKKRPISRFLLDLQRAIEDLDYMRRKAMDVKARSGTKAEQQRQPTHSIATPTSSTSNNTTMVGSDDVLVQLLDLLTGVPSSRRVITIVGMGGIGKTTLATNAFQNKLIVYRFDVCLWATISQYKVEHIVSELLSHLKISNSCRAVGDERDELYKSLCGRRYLIILDDMWSLQAWDELNFLFPDTSNGSRIVVTTRNSYVANGLADFRLAMSFLDEGNSWDLFCHKVFAAEQVCPPELEGIGKKIVEKCRGLPLAIVVVGGHLRKSSMALEYWESVAYRMNSILNSTENDEQCVNVLSLSYSFLPAHLKPCFLLLGAFPEDERINVSQVVRLWIAEGVLQPLDMCPEEVVQMYLWDLFARNLILVNWTGTNGNIMHFKLHDLVREMCLKIAKQEEFLYVIDTPRAMNRERRVVINGKIPELKHQPKSCYAPTIRCCTYEGGWLSYDFKLLRTLNKVVATSMSASIFQQLNLRFLELDFINKSVRTFYLPSSISLLWNLQALNIYVPHQSIVVAPYAIWEMLQLRHLDVNPISLTDPLPVDHKANDDLALRNLHTLRNVENFRLSEEACKRIPNIRELNLSYRDEASLYYCPQNLGGFYQLETLHLQFHDNSKWRDFALSITFPKSLKWLVLCGCGVHWEELTVMVGSLPNLRCLHLYAGSVIGSVWNPVEGDFPSLQCLDIRGCDDLINWNADYFHFPVLRNLRLRCLSKLVQLPTGIEEILTLRLIELLQYCSESATISAMRILAEHEEEGNEDLRVEISYRGDEETLKSFNNKVPQEVLTSKNLILCLPTVKP